MNSKKKIFFILLFCSSLFLLVAGTKTFRFGSSTLQVVYDEAVYQGDPVFIKLIVDSPFIQNNIKANAQVVETKTGKKIRSAAMYESKGAKNFFVGIPLSTFISPGNYNIQIFLESNVLTEKLTIPFLVKEKEFIAETIPLDPVNTAIKTDTSPQRMAQIDRLNTLLMTINTKAEKNLESFMLPVQSTRRTSFFGDRRIFSYSNGTSETSLHYGIDFGVPIGTDVFACGSGNVVMSEMRNTTGWTIVIEHLPGLYSLYYHLDELLVKNGDIVKKGEIIAQSGKTGLATGPHLHWEIRLLSEAVNPDYFVEKFSLFD